MTPTACRHRAIAPVLAGAIALATGCSALLDTSNPLLNGPCATDSDCPSLQTCVPPTCQPICESNGDCAEGETCQPLREAKVCVAALDANVAVGSSNDGTVIAKNGDRSGQVSDSSLERDPASGRRSDTDGAPDGGPEATPGDGSIEAEEVADGGVEPPEDSNGDGDVAVPTLWCPEAGVSRVVLFGGQESLAQNATFLNDTWKLSDGAWGQTPTGDAGPSARWAGAATSICNGMFLFSGQGSPTALIADDWIWQGGFWSPQSQSPLPPARMDPSIAVLNGKIVMFGGYRGDYTVYGDTWVWDGAWTAQTPDASPSPPRRAAAATAPVGGVVVVFGGDDGQGDPLGDTWLWNGSSWAQAQPSQSPPARLWTMAATLGDKAVMFGGFDGINYLSDTWTWDGQTWTQEQPAVSPTPRAYPAIAAVDHEIVLFGGQDPSGNPLGDTWTWNGMTWTQLDIPGPSPRIRPMMASF